MIIEDLSDHDIVEAKCIRCEGVHVWAVKSLKTAPRVSMQCLDGKQSCGNNAQLVFADKIDRVVGKH